MYAAGAGQAAAAYCLYLHHLALGERDTADFWRRQTDDVQPPLEPAAFDHAGAWRPADHRIASTSTTHFMRILRHLPQQTVRSRPPGVSKLMAYIPTAVAAGYLREPDAEPSARARVRPPHQQAPDRGRPPLHLGHLANPLQDQFVRQSR
ncbi:hypothetical protein ACF09Y_34050 [Streptomyces massasporeus]|uniref:hypothetical protein n=1 Tax=Streptomyces massasporeus TaxID=67324 RepID=UPI00370254B7